MKVHFKAVPVPLPLLTVVLDNHPGPLLKVLRLDMKRHLEYMSCHVSVAPRISAKKCQASAV